MVVHNGRLWRGFEDLGGATGWPQLFRAFAASAPVGSDLLNVANWTWTASMPSPAGALDSKFNGWLEGNMVVTPAGTLAEILRADTKAGITEQAALIDYGSNGTAGVFDPNGRPAENPNDNSGFIPFPGGAKKFTIRRDPITGDYWSLVNRVLPPWYGNDPIYIRNLVSLVRSTDLVHWETRCDLLFHPDVGFHAFQYLDWQFDGNDLVAVSRTSWQGRNYHDANFITFHRVSNFRTLTTANSIATDGSITWPFPGLEVTGSRFTPALLENGTLAYGNRNYLWDEVPKAFANSLITQVSGGIAASMKLKAVESNRAYLASSTAPWAGGLPGWISTGQSFCSNDGGRTRMHLYRRDFVAGQEVIVPQTTWTGTLLVVPPKTTPVGWWRCESTYGNTAVADEFFAFHGKPSSPSGPLAMAFGRFGGALRFNPGQHVDLGNVFPLTRVPFTISMWIRLDAGDTTPGVPLSKMNAGSFDGYAFEVNPAGSPGKIRFSASSASAELQSNQAINDGLWHHVAVTSKPAGNQILYVDGVEQARCPAPEIRATSAALRFGARTVNNAAEAGFIGLLDEIQIYHSALPAARIVELSADPTSPASPPGIPVPIASFTGPSRETWENPFPHQARLSWEAIPGRSYGIFRSPDLERGSWQLIDVITPETNIGEFEENASTGRAFFRVELLP
ncbi:LamG domain-containing protein [Luteolibacter sp. Populi]|uniref:LamG domain-containing protein n=1 Tax=Luteolibacter sp. Populi TaxID=3230487 RepID=UPI0034658AB0